MVEQMFELGDLDKNAFTKAPLVNAWAKQASVAEAVLWLFSPASSFVIGQPIPVDGGVTAGGTDLYGKSVLHHVRTVTIHIKYLRYGE
jgi:NAD(P)-dependent dehydrogenase (short-subunit alcohol dehydrogenase family)